MPALQFTLIPAQHTCGILKVFEDWVHLPSVLKIPYTVLMRLMMQEISYNIELLTIMVVLL